MDKKKHECVLCNTLLNSKEELQIHFRKHANKEIDLKGRPVGPRGEVKSTSANGVYIRGSGSQVEASVTCDVCGEEFTCNTKAIQHKFRKHPFNAAKHYCPQCGMQFPLQGHRDKHLKEQHESDHIPPNPYPCYQCGAVFYNQAAHEYHDKTTHHRVVTLYKQIQTPAPSKKIRYNNAGEPQSVYYCHLCGQEYIVKFNLQKHIERQHPPEQRNLQPTTIFKCNTCDALFYNTKAYHNHNIHHKADDLYVTSEEQRLQVVTRVDQDFDIRRVQPAAERYIPKFRQRRSKQLPPPAKTGSPATKPDEEELSPPPDSDSDPEPPPQKKSTTKKIYKNNKNLGKSLTNDVASPPPSKNNKKPTNSTLGCSDVVTMSELAPSEEADSLNNNGEGDGDAATVGNGAELPLGEGGGEVSPLEDPLSQGLILDCPGDQPAGTNLLPGIENPEEPVLLQAL